AHRRAAATTVRGHALWDLGRRPEAQATYVEAQDLLSAPLRVLDLCELVGEVTRRGIVLAEGLEELAPLLREALPDSARGAAWLRLASDLSEVGIDPRRWGEGSR
ncbi:MAG: hypothetical protein JKY65_15440, partial [Planctomycetes bacterium]|nr:hypothetical protein [Planctomycetota bacterium]